MEQDQLTGSEQDLLNQLAGITTREADTVLASASRLLSQISNYVGLVTSPYSHEPADIGEAGTFGSPAGFSPAVY